jgi:NAD(P)-dependent dehydrogenase (short-subunit alcohol dehydrogenase family)
MRTTKTMTDLTGKVMIVTGATNGIGEATALELARMGATVGIISRSEGKCQATVERIKTETGNSNVRYFVADLSVQSQVRAVAAQVREAYDRLDALVNNAGAWFSERKLSADGIEMTFALNHLNYFLLTHELLDLLKSTAAEQGEARVVSVSSMAHHSGEMHWDDIEFTDWERGRTRYPGWGVYEQSKLANVLFAYALNRKLEGTGVISNAVHPGVVVTGFTQNNGLLYQVVAPIRRLFNRNTALDGAMPSIYLASSPEAKGITGKYYGPPHKEEPSKDITHDIETQDRLWALSEQMTGLVQPA